MKNIYDQGYYENRSEKTLDLQVIDSALQEIFNSVKTRLKKSLNKITVLDVGSGSGEYSFAIEKYVKKVIAVEPYKEIYERSIKNKKKLKSKVVFYNCLVEKLDVIDKPDLVLSLTTLEHMPNAYKSYKKILKMMNKGGIIYITCPNRLWPFENHYKLFFLSWLPLPLANFYVKITRRGVSYKDSAYSLSYFGIKKLFNSLPCEYEFILPKNINSPYYGCGHTSFYHTYLKLIGIWLIKRINFFWFFSKGFIVLVTKK